jgi:thioredoxin reductase (NADPH)
MAQKNSVTVVALCAAWCHTCGEFRAAFDRIAARWPGARFVWLDVEDEADIVGDIDVENFPTLAIYQDGRLVHFGVSLPQEGVAGRLVEACLEEARAPLEGPEPAATLPQRLSSRS